MGTPLHNAVSDDLEFASPRHLNVDLIDKKACETITESFEDLITEER